MVKKGFASFVHYAEHGADKGNMISGEQTTEVPTTSISSTLISTVHVPPLQLSSHRSQL
jgi:hypothetical protein